ncbi:MAG TPA: lipid-binding protein [Hanamia sp.]|nr:lipid-binding protein [Hanamia sp.]
MKRIFPIIIILMALFAISCKKAIPDYGKTATENASNGWWVTFTLGGQDVYGLGHQFISTYNTSENPDSIWIDDLGHTWNFKCKAAINYQALTFSTTSSQNEYYDDTVTIQNGKILLKAGHSKSGNVTDSIYMEATFSDDPTDTYIISGTARTGFIEDDY